MPENRLEAVLELEVDTRKAVTSMRSAMSAITKEMANAEPNVEKINRAMSRLSTAISKMTATYDNAADAKQRFLASGAESQKNIVAMERLNQIILALARNLGVANNAAGNLYNTMEKIPAGKRGGSVINNLSRSQRNYQNYQAELIGKQASGGIITEAELQKLERLKQKFEESTESARNFRQEVETGAVTISKHIGETLGNAIDEADKSLGRLDKGFDRIFGANNKRRIEEFTRGVKMQMDDMGKSVSRAMDSVRDSMDRSVHFNRGAADNALNAIAGQRQTLLNKMAGAKTQSEKDVVAAELSKLSDMEYDVRRNLTNMEYRHNKAVNPNYGISGTALNGNIALERAGRFISSANTSMREGGAVSFGAGLPKFESDARLHLTTIREYVIQATREIQDIESKKVDSTPDNLKALKQFVDEAVELQRQIESKAASLGSRGRVAYAMSGEVRRLASDHLASQFAPAGSRLGRFWQNVSGDRAFAGMSTRQIRQVQTQLNEYLASGDLDPNEQAMARALMSTANARIAAGRKSPLGNMVRSPWAQRMFLGSSNWLTGGGFGGALGGFFSPYGNQMIGNAFHKGNVLTSHVSALMGLPLYGMGIAGLGMAGMRGSLGLAAQAETQKLTLSGLVNTFMKFNAAGRGANFDPAQNFVMSQRYSDDLYQKIRERARVSILTTPELFDYFMAGGAKGMSRGLSGEQALGVVDKMATLGKAMGLRPLDVQQDIRALFAGDVRATNKLGILMGFNGPMVKGALDKGPQAFMELFESKFKGFSQAMTKMPDTLTGSLNMLLDTLQQFGIDIGQKIAPIIIPAIRALGDAIQEMRDSGELDEIANKMGQMMKSGIQLFTALIKNFDGFTEAMSNLLKAFIVYKAVATVAALFNNLGMAMGAVGGLSTAIVAFVGILIYQNKLLRDSINNKSADVSNVSGPYYGMTNENKDNAKRAAVSSLEGRGSGVSLFGQNFNDKEAARLSQIFGVSKTKISGVGEANQVFLTAMEGLKGDKDWEAYKNKYNLSDREALAKLTRDIANDRKSTFPAGSQRAISAFFSGTAEDLDPDLAKILRTGGSSGIDQKTYRNLSNLILSEMVNPNNIQGFVNNQSKLDAINDIYNSAQINVGNYTNTPYASGLGSIKVGKKKFGSLQEAENYIKNAPDSPEKRAFMLEYAKLGGIADMSYTTTDMGVGDTGGAGGKSQKQLRTRLDYQIALQGAKLGAISNMISKTPDIAMAGGQFAKMGMFQQEFNASQMLAGLNYQSAYATAAKDGDAWAIKEAQVAYVTSVVEAKNKYMDQVRALQESVKAIEDQTDEVIRATTLMKAQFGLKQAQFGLSQVSPTSAGYLSAVGGVYAAGVGVVDTQYANALADITAKESAVQRSLGDWNTQTLMDMASGKRIIPGLDPEVSKSIASGILGTMQKGNFTMAEAQSAYFNAQRAQAGQARQEAMFGLGIDRQQALLPYAQSMFEGATGRASIASALRFSGLGQMGAERMASIQAARAQANLELFDLNNRGRAEEIQRMMVHPNPWIARKGREQMAQFVAERQGLMDAVVSAQFSGQEAVRREQLAYAYSGGASALGMERTAMMNQYTSGGLGEVGLGRFGALSTVQYNYDMARNQISQDALKYQALLESDYGRNVLRINPSDVQRRVAEYAFGREQALMSSYQSQFGTARMSDARFGALGAFAGGMYGSPGSMLSLSGIAGLASTALSGGMDLGQQRMQDVMRFLANPKDAKLREAFTKSIPAKFAGDPYGYARQYAISSIGGGIAGAWIGTQIGGAGSAGSVATGQTIGMGLASLGAFANVLPGIPGGGELFGAVVGGLLGGLFGRRGRRPDPKEEAHRKRVEDLLSRIDKSLRPQNDYFRTVNRDILFGSASRFLSGRFAEDLAGASQRV